MIVSQLIINSIVIGNIYALVAGGFSIIYSTNRFVHFAHGSCVAVGAYLLYLFYSLLNIPFFIAALGSLLTTTALGIGIYISIYKPLQKRKASSIILLIASVGILIFCENFLSLTFGPTIKTIKYLPINRGIEIFGANITLLQIITLSVCIGIFILLSGFIKKTRIGKHMRAVAENPELAKIVGINQEQITILSFGIGSFLAGIAGIFIGLEQNLQPIMGMKLMIPAFTAAVIGGIMIVHGAIISSYILGFATTISIWFLPSGYKDAIIFGLMFLFLLLKPTGLFGSNNEG